MNDHLDDGPLDGELADLERALAASGATPPGDLEGRVLSAVGRELAAQTADPHAPALCTLAEAPRNGFSGFAIAAAAMLLAAMNFAISVTRPAGLPAPQADPRQAQAVYEDIRSAVPELSPAEARRQSLLLTAASAWPAYPPPPPRGLMNAPLRQSQLDQLLENGHGIRPVLD